MTSYEDTIARIEELYHGPILPASQVGLQRVSFLLQAIGNPQHDFRSIHVAGSSGKGSTTTMIGAILQGAGFRTGYFRSPHLADYRERIAIDGTEIPPEAWVVGMERIWPVVEGMRSGTIAGYDLGRPALFEVLFALAALYFSQSDVEWVAAETGMGGRLDATNTLQPDVAVITNVSLEHTHILGKTIPAIAREKAAIIKPGSHAATAAEADEALDVVRARATDVGAPLLEVDRDIRYQVLSETLSGQTLLLEGPGSHLTVTLSLAGRFQARNAATAYAAALALRERGQPVADAALERGLSKVRFPGRLEVAGSNPTILLDGAHNPAAAWELRRSLDRLIPQERVVLLFAAMADKDVGAMAEALGPLASVTVLTRAPGAERAAPTERLAAAFAAKTSRVVREDDVDRAFDIALAETGGRGVLLVAGSLYHVGYLRNRLLASVAP